MRVTVPSPFLVVAVSLKRLEPVLYGAACLIDRRCDDHKPLATSPGDLHDAGSQVRRNSRLKPGTKHKRSHIPAPRGGSGRRRCHSAVGHMALKTFMSMDPLRCVLSRCSGDPARLGIWGREAADRNPGSATGCAKA